MKHKFVSIPVMCCQKRCKILLARLESVFSLYEGVKRFGEHSGSLMIIK